MKWFYRFFTMGILAAAIIGPFFIKKPDGEPIMSFPTTEDLNPTNLLSSDKSSTSGGNAFNPTSTSIFKWQDEQGQWHYGDAPPENNPSVSSLQVDTNTNIIQSLKMGPDEPDQLEAVPEQANQKLPERLTNGELSFDNALNAINDAKMVREMMESRNDQLKAINGEN